MVEREVRRAAIESQFSSLESYWEFDVPEALEHKDWSEYAILDFFTNAMGLPAARYDALVKDIGEEFRQEFAHRLARLDALIQIFEPEVIKFLNS
jgi:hypothetical protein